MRDPGQPLDPPVREFLQSRLQRRFSGGTARAGAPTAGIDLHQVRIHADARSAEAARTLGARALTIGTDILFGEGAYAPGTTAGQALLAHELAHVVQQWSTGRRVIARQPVERLEERGHGLSREDAQSLTTGSYWFARVQETYVLAPVPPRLVSDPEERDAVLSVLWRVRPPGPVRQVTRRVVRIPARAAAGSTTLLYELTFSPKDPGDPGGKDGVRITFLAAGATASPIATEPRRSFRSSVSSYSMRGFPTDGPTYWQAHPQEERQVFHWIEELAPPSFDRILTTREDVKRKGVTTTRRTSFQVTGTKDKSGRVLQVTITHLGVLDPTVEAVPATYRDKDVADVGIEKAQAEPDPALGDRLGTLTIPPTVPADERAAVKVMALHYFRNGTRNAEVDVIVPVPGKAGPVYYTLRFRSDNGVDVERIGEQGVGAGRVDPHRLDVARAPEFAAATKDVGSLTAWLKSRYPRLTPSGTTTDELRDNANAEVAAKAGSPEWFRNYGITVLDAQQGAARLRQKHRLVAGQVKDMKTFQPAELKNFEAVLETASRRILARFRSLRMARQRIFVDRQKDGTLVEVTDRAGTTFTNGSDRTIAIYDNGFTGQGIFLGGSGDVFPWDAEVFAHELGHVVGATAQTAFNKFVAARGIKPFTRYAGEKPQTEFFPEAFQIYQTDPEWLRTNQPEVFAWFETLAKTGKPPRG